MPLAYHIGRRCRDSTIKAVAEEFNLDWHTVKELDTQYMRAQAERAASRAGGSATFSVS